MENKEAILFKHFPEVQTFKSTTAQCILAMDEYSASQNEELQKAFENNKEQLMELATHAKDLESTIDEKNKELANCGFTITALDIMITEKDKEIERLNGLIETLHSEAFGINPVKWWEYKRQNNL